MKISKVLGFLKKWLVVALVVGMIIPIYGMLKTIYWNNKTACVRVSFVYQGIENGLYPDGQRFLMYDMMDDELVKMALEAMQARGWYKGYDERELQTCVFVKSYLANPVQDKVESTSESGQSFSYYTNEYVISFTQPTDIHLRNPANFFGMFDKDRSSEFLNELVRANLLMFSQKHTDNGDAFRTLTEDIDIQKYDYSQLATLFNSRISDSISYLSEKNIQGNAFVAKSTGSSFNDLIISFRSLYDTDVATFKSYVSSSRLTKKSLQYMNNTNVLIEKLNFAMLKSGQTAALSTTAMLDYDHALTENIVIVGVNEENGLYQAHPKTGYDTVTQQSLTAGVNEASNKQNIAKLSQELSEYLEKSTAPTYDGDVTKANKMIKDIQNNYDRLRTNAIKTVEEYLVYCNSDYLKTVVVKTNSFSIGDLAKALIEWLVISSLILLAVFLMQYLKVKIKALGEVALKETNGDSYISIKAQGRTIGNKFIGVKNKHSKKKRRDD